MQIKTSETAHIAGTGLGLGIARALCELMGGTITLRSAPKQGSVFLATMQLAWKRDLVASEVASLGNIVVPIDQSERRWRNDVVEDVRMTREDTDFLHENESQRNAVETSSSRFFDQVRTSNPLKWVVLHIADDSSTDPGAK